MSELAHRPARGDWILGFGPWMKVLKPKDLLLEWNQEEHEDSGIYFCSDGRNVYLHGYHPMAATRRPGGVATA